VARAAEGPNGPRKGLSGVASRTRDLKNGERQKNQMELAFAAGPKGETRKQAGKGTEPFAAKRETESPTSAERLMEEVVERENLKKALRRVKSNKGSAGVDGMTVEQLPAYLTAHWSELRTQLLGGTYKPQPVKRVDIPKPEGGKRKLGIPTVLDRFVQQAVMQVLQRQFEPTFSEHSHGFRPNHSAHQAVSEAQQYVAEGYEWVVDIDLEKFFDRVNHDRLMTTLARSIRDKRVLKLIRAFLNAGVMENGLVSATTEGTPQGGPLSPLLSNIVLDELDRELEKRGHRFVRYADDCNVYVRTERAAQRVMTSVSTFIARKLKLKVNDAKSAVGKPRERKFLGFTLVKHKERIKRAIAPLALRRLKAKIRVLTRRTRGGNLEQIVAELTVYLRGWKGYFGFCETRSVLPDLDSWIRRRLRSLIWKRWKRGTVRFGEMVKRGVSRKVAAQMAGSAHGPWHLSRSQALSVALPNAYFESLGLLTLAS
jgi:RNA-directed DNA polymerase